MFFSKKRKIEVPEYGIIKLKTDKYEYELLKAGTHKLRRDLDLVSNTDIRKEVFIIMTLFPMLHKIIGEGEFFKHIDKILQSLYKIFDDETWGKSDFFNQNDFVISEEFQIMPKDTEFFSVMIDLMSSRMNMMELSKEYPIKDLYNLILDGKFEGSYRALLTLDIIIESGIMYPLYYAEAGDLPDELYYEMKKELTMKQLDVREKLDNYKKEM